MGNTRVAVWSFRSALRLPVNLAASSTLLVAAIILVAFSGPAAAAVTRESDLVAWWQMGEGATWYGFGWTVPDDSANTNTAESAGDVLRVEGAFGGASYAMQFDGDFDYLMAPHDPSIDFGYEDFSVSMWVKASEADLDSYDRLFQKGTYGSPQKKCHIGVDPDSRMVHNSLA